MNLKSRCSLLFYVVICLTSCSEKEASEQDIFLTVSERKEFHIGEGGLVPDRFHSVSLDQSRSRGVIFNEIAHSLDSIFISVDSASVKDGDILETEGPNGVGTVFSFFASKEHTVYMNSQEFFKQDNATKEVSRKLLHEYKFFGDLEYPAISVNSNPEFNAFDERTNTGYFVYVKDNRISVIGYNPVADSIHFIPVPLDSANFFNLRFEVKFKGLTLGGGDDPQLSVVGDKLIVSYPSFSDILVYDLLTSAYQVFTSTSNLYPSRKNIPPNYADEVDSSELLDELFKLWDNQIRYGPITYLEDHDKYARNVKGEKQVNRPYYLEVFDSDFKKLNEFNLMDINPDLSSSYLNTKYGLMFRAQDQPDEDVMYYYYVNLTDLK